ncbi:hypothetical protein [uncultured Methylobacterium sp.]|uniref:hypothetical protein n=1 Tax=uncultured Methylobacterium sp. TaxID=157278 RepID=UPI0035CA7D2B
MDLGGWSLAVTDVGDRPDWRTTLAGFVTDLGTGEDQVPLERVLRRHKSAFDAVLATGRTWPQIARALTAAGARHRRGQPMSAKQLRTVYARSSAVDTGSAKASRPPSGTVLAASPLRAAAAAAQPTIPAAQPASPSIALTEAGRDRVMRRLTEARAARAAIMREFDE